MEDWEVIYLTSFKRAWYTTTFHMAHFITKFMSNTFPTMTILHRRLHATTNLCPWCGLSPDTIQHMYQCIHKGSRWRWTVPVDALLKWIKDQNMDPEIAILLAGTLLYIVGERSYLTQCMNLTLHSYILHIGGWLSIILGIILTSLAFTQQNYFIHIGSKIIGLKWASQIITQIWKLIWGQ